MKANRVLWAVAAAVALGAGLALFVGASLLTDRPGFCPTCHEMTPYYDAWAAGAHADVWCIDCHVERGLPARFGHKFVALGEVRAHFAGDIRFPRPVSPEVPNARCEGCHPSVAEKPGQFSHSMHAEKGDCAECHYRTGHSVTPAALRAAGVFAPDVVPQRLGGRLATVGAGAANLPGHPRVSCSQCHDMNATPCSACHTPPHEKRGECGTCHRAAAAFAFSHPAGQTDCASCHKRPAKHPAGACTTCHKKSGVSWAFAHPGSAATCTDCHKPPASHYRGACVSCHREPGSSWAFRHPATIGEHSWQSIPCNKCHPSGTATVSCTCHGGGIPSGD